MPRLRHLPLLLFALIALVFYIRLALQEDKTPARFDPYPAAELTAGMLYKDADIFTLSSVKGKFVLINFFASWCAPCVAEVPHLKSLSDSGKLEVVGIAWNDTERRVQKFLKRHGNPYKILMLDIEGQTGMDYGITGVPENYLIDEQGNVVWRFAGALNEALVENEILARVK